MKFNIKNDELAAINGSYSTNFPKYTSQLINWANQNAQGTRPRVVGQLSELFPEFEKTSENINIKEWEIWYLDKYPDAINNATDKIWGQINNLKNAISLIDKNMVFEWVKDLVIAKTYNGFYFQEAILSMLAKKTNLSYRLANPNEESKGIDGFVGDIAYSIKPDTYKSINARSISDDADVKMIYYAKKSDKIIVEVEE